MAHEVYFLLYVADQERSAAFYRAVLAVEPIVDVPGITEFPLRDGTVLAVMPEASVRRNIGDDAFGEPATGRPRAEVYLVVDEPVGCHERALRHGGRELSPFEDRAWHHRAAYSLDPDGHVLAFAERLGAGDP